MERDAIVHEIKFRGRGLCDAVHEGVKVHEVRLNDRDYRVGDFIRPISVNDDMTLMNHPIDYDIFEITFVSENYPGIAPGYCVFSIRKVSTG